MHLVPNEVHSKNPDVLIRYPLSYLRLLCLPTTEEKSDTKV